MTEAPRNPRDPRAWQATHSARLMRQIMALTTETLRQMPRAVRPASPPAVAECFVEMGRLRWLHNMV